MNQTRRSKDCPPIPSLNFQKTSLRIHVSCPGRCCAARDCMMIRQKSASVKERGVLEDVLPRANSSFQTLGSHPLAPHATVSGQPGSSLASITRGSTAGVAKRIPFGWHDTDSCRRQAIVDASKVPGTSGVKPIPSPATPSCMQLRCGRSRHHTPPILRIKSIE
jgi:hypothetical protein